MNYRYCPKCGEEMLCEFNPVCDHCDPASGRARKAEEKDPLPSDRIKELREWFDYPRHDMENSDWIAAWASAREYVNELLDMLEKKEQSASELMKANARLFAELKTESKAERVEVEKCTWGTNVKIFHKKENQ